MLSVDYARGIFTNIIQLLLVQWGNGKFEWLWASKSRHTCYDPILQIRSRKVAFSHPEIQVSKDSTISLSSCHINIFI